MSSVNIVTRLKRYHQRLNGSTLEYDLSAYQNILNEINKFKNEFEEKSNNELKKISQMLINKAKECECLNEFLIEAFALVREAIRRVLRLNPFDVQIIGGIIMHYGKLAEMQTGEGKTLTAVFPAYLNALSGKGVHVLTFNDYLARRDANGMGQVYEFLGLSVGFVQEGMTTEERQKAYGCDVTYITAKEAGFDYLRDSLSYNKADIVHREFNYAIVDEADSILIDEARVPLIIACASEEYVADSHYVSKIAKRLKENEDFDFDEYARNFHLTEGGVKRIEDIFNFSNLYDEGNIELLTRLNCAIHAEYLLHRDVDYIVRNGKVELVDEFTGRVADKRRWPDGLQAAIEAKENINIQSKGKILNSITIQHFIQMYPKICGMTATAHAAEREFKNFYNLDIVVIPPNRPCIRKDHRDIIFGTKKAKRNTLVNEIVRINKTQRPILIGTRSVEESISLADDLQRQGVECQVLNAKKDEYEAGIVAGAGKLGVITVSTNMAGRGTDIRLGGVNEEEKNKVIALGGLYVIGTNRHESQRIDNQLRGRAGRQGDPGFSCFFVGLEDDLFVKYRLKDFLPSDYIVDQDGKFDNPFVRKEVNRIQRVVEAQNQEIKITLCRYSSLLEKQRKIIFQKRKDILYHNSVPDIYQSNAPDQFKILLMKIGEQELIKTCKYLYLFYLDKYWSRYLAEVADIREGIHLQSLGGEDPLFVFHKLTLEMFRELQQNIEREIINAFNGITIKNNIIEFNNPDLKVPTSTWTYLINDNPFENMFGLQFIGNRGIGISLGVLMVWPLMILFPLLKKISRKTKRHRGELLE
jgi:preprotein translocase subunit SecA